MNQVHTIEERISILSQDSHGYTTELNKVAFYDNPSKLDIRKWDGDRPLKGITLTDKEAMNLCTALHEYFTRKGLIAG